MILVLLKYYLPRTIFNITEIAKYCPRTIIFIAATDPRNLDEVFTYNHIGL